MLQLGTVQYIFINPLAFHKTIFQLADFSQYTNTHNNEHMHKDRKVNLKTYL